jgi:HSP20 family protein
MSIPAIIRYNPWSLLRDMQADLSDVATGQWVPQVDIKEKKNGFEIIADLPGVPPENIKVSMDSNVLTLKGQREAEAKQEDENYSRVERSSGSFYRRFSLPDNVDSSQIRAKNKQGVLVLTIPKKEPKRPQEINIDIER